MDIILQGGSTKEVNVFKYLSVDMLADGATKNEVNHRTDEGEKGGWYTKESLETKLSMEVRRGMYDSTVRQHS